MAKNRPASMKPYPLSYCMLRVLGLDSPPIGFECLLVEGVVVESGGNVVGVGLRCESSEPIMCRRSHYAGDREYAIIIYERNLGRPCDAAANVLVQRNQHGTLQHLPTRGIRQGGGLLSQDCGALASLKNKLNIARLSTLGPTIGANPTTLRMGESTSAAVPAVPSIE